MTDPTVAGLSNAHISCFREAGLDTRTAQQPILPTPVECNTLAVGLGIHNYDPNNQLCLACLINTMATLPNGDEAFQALQICGAGTGLKYGHDGNSGQLILSKYPIKNVREHSFDAFVANRVNILATINGIKFGFGYFAFNLLEDASAELAPLMYGALQTAQAQHFVDNAPEVILGDLNSGPEYQRYGYDLLFASGYHHVSPEKATWCDPTRANFAPCINAGAVPMMIDHIFIRNSSRVMHYNARLFNKNPITSDHIGVGATVYNCWWCFWL
eukprot:TRINITY_DN5533_c0_g2_i1.p1 TRINITY_DN5533_c0_g2~~TRINITY_DN5533_c0_g2_i1.p1  ORF type:complete len:272 (+),score=32.85 TRINITY_DN5533_c0_g2_i1:268-1083(+)